MLEMYGDGLARIVAALEAARRRCAIATLAADGVVASLLLIHGLYPVPLDERVQRGARRVRPVHGVARRQRRAARRRGRGGAAAAGGQLRRLPGLGLDAGAGDQARRSTRRAPDLAGLEVEGLVERAAAVRKLPPLGRPERRRAGDWVPCGRRRRSAPGR